MIGFILGVILAVTPTQLDKDGRAAFNTLRDFQRIVATEFRTQKRWPTGEQYKTISQHVECGYLGITASMAYGLDGPNSQVYSMMSHSMNCVELLSQYVNRYTQDQPEATPEAKKAVFKALAAYKKLMVHFPWTPGEK